MLSGAVFALGFYTYIAFRIMAPLLFMILAWPLLASLKNHQFVEAVKKYWKAALLFTVAFLIFIFPIADALRPRNGQPD